MMKMKCVMVTGHKGGIGKTLISCNIALALAEKKKKTALIDADIASSNIAEFMNIEQPMSLEREKLFPGRIDGIQAFSMSLLVGSKAVSMNSVQYSELLRDAIELGEWDAEYAIVDMPAGSADEFKRIISLFGNDFIGSVIVIQPAHETDARRVITLHIDNGIPIVGLIENMSSFKGGVVNYAIFGESIIDRIAKEFGLKNLGKIPLSMKIRKSVANKNPRLPEDLIKPINNAVDKIVTLQPKKPGFLTRIKEKVKGVIGKAVVTFVLAANKEVNIGALQQKFGYPGGRIIRLNVMDNNMEVAIVQADFRIWDGKLVAIEEQYTDQDIVNNGVCRIDIKPHAIANAILGNKQHADGSIYDLEAAWRLGDARIYGKGDTIRGAYFFKEVWNEVRQNQKALEKLAPLLEALL